ncbi:MAG: hypothetical protein J6112_10345, partial [Clostridia bacterium]|nr:hypothetical protein [Clostridia bacterium]
LRGAHHSSPRLCLITAPQAHHSPLWLCRHCAERIIFHFSLFTAPQAPLREAHHYSLRIRRHCAKRIIFHCVSGATFSVFFSPFVLYNHSVICSSMCRVSLCVARNWRSSS